jgi:hypothetical protein
MLLRGRTFLRAQTQADAVRDVIKQWKAVGVRPQAFQGADLHRAASTVLSRAIRHEVADVFLDDLDDRDLLTPDPQACRNRLRGCEAPKDCAAGGSSTGSKITVLGWAEASVVRSGSRGFGVVGSSWKCAFASIVW